MKISIVAVLFLLGVSGATQGLTQPSPRCVSMQEIVKSLSHSLHPSQILQLKNQEARTYLALLNAEPPQSNARADTLVIVVNPDMAVHVIFAFEQGCLTARGVIDQNIGGRFLAQVLGVEA